jgi:large subunit ribosomal protein L4
MKRGAIRSALTDALQSGKLAAVDGLSFDEPRTKTAAALIDSLELTGKVLVVLHQPDEVVEKSFRNLPYVRVSYARSLGVYEVIAADRVLLTGAALDLLEGKEVGE